jgi:hypothetical protein
MEYSNSCGLGVDTFPTHGYVGWGFIYLKSLEKAEKRVLNPSSRKNMVTGCCPYPWSEH